MLQISSDQEEAQPGANTMGVERRKGVEKREREKGVGVEEERWILRI